MEDDVDVEARMPLHHGAPAAPISYSDSSSTLDPFETYLQDLGDLTDKVKAALPRHVSCALQNTAVTFQLTLRIVKEQQSPRGQCKPMPT